MLALSAIDDSSLPSGEQARSITRTDTLSSSQDGLRASRLALTHRVHTESNKALKWTLLHVARRLFAAYFPFERLPTLEHHPVRPAVLDCNPRRHLNSVLKTALEPCRRPVLRGNLIHEPEGAERRPLHLDLEQRYSVATSRRAHHSSSISMLLSEPDFNKILRRLHVRGYLTDDLWRLLYPLEKDVNLCEDSLPVELLALLVQADLLHQELRSPSDVHCRQLKALKELHELRIQVHEQVEETRYAAAVNGAELLYDDRLQRLLSIASKLVSSIDVADEVIQHMRDELFTADWNVACATDMIAQVASRSGLTDSDILATSWEDDWTRWNTFLMAQNKLIRQEEANRAKVSSDLTILGERMLDVSSLGAVHSDSPVNATKKSGLNSKECMTAEEKKVIDMYRDRLINEVRADSLLDHLIMHRTVSLEESAEVFVSLETGGQMRKLLDILTTRVNSSKVFDEFLTSLAGKYKALHDAMRDTYGLIMEESIARKPDALENCVKLLADVYLGRTDKFIPVPWYPNGHISLEKWAQPISLLNEKAWCENWLRSYESRSFIHKPLFNMYTDDAEATIRNRMPMGTDGPQSLNPPSLTQQYRDDDGPDFATRIVSAIANILNVLFIWLTFPISFKTIAEYERGVILRLGKAKRDSGYIEILEPGLRYLVPCIDTLLKVDMRLKSINIPPQEVLTKDAVTVTVDAIVFMRVVHADAALFNVENAFVSAQFLAISTLRSLLGQFDLAEVLQERDRIDKMLQQELDKATDPWGIVVERVEIKDVGLPLAMQRAMAAEAQATRQAKARAIEAEGELKASDLLAQASERFTDNPSALHLRYLQTVTTVAAEKNSTILFPVPMELLEAFKAFAGKSQ